MFSDRTDWRTAECAGEMQFFEALNHTRICYFLQQSYPVRPAYINWDGWKVNDVCNEELLAFWPVRNRQDAPLGAIFLLGIRGRQWRLYHFQFPTTDHITLTISQPSDLRRVFLQLWREERRFELLFFPRGEEGAYLPPPASVRFSFGEWMRPTDVHWPAKWEGQVTITALHK